MRLPYIFLAITAILFPAHGRAAPFQVGDQFTGTLTINPATPCMSCFNIPQSQYYTYQNAGSDSVTIDGTTLYGGSMFISVDYDSSAPAISSWYGGAASANAAIYIQLAGSTPPSSAIYPSNLSSYTQNDLLPQITFVFYDSMDPVAGYSYYGNFNSLNAVDAFGDFSFSGTVTRFDEFVQTAVPEPSTWAMLLIGFAGIGFAGRFHLKTARARSVSDAPVQPTVT
jgi:PEP-CTERM motif